MSNTKLDLEKEAYSVYHAIAIQKKNYEAAQREYKVLRQGLATKLNNAPKDQWPRGYAVGWRKQASDENPEVDELELEIEKKTAALHSQSAARIYELNQKIWEAEQEIYVLTNSREIEDLKAKLVELKTSGDISVKPYLITKKFALAEYEHKLALGEFAAVGG